MYGAPCVPVVGIRETMPSSQVAYSLASGENQHSSRFIESRISNISEASQGAEMSLSRDSMNDDPISKPNHLQLGLLVCWLCETLV